MSDDTRSDIDPRFDPAFQRGFEGAAPARERRAPTSRPSTPVAPVAPRVVEPVVVQSPVAPAAAPAVAEPVEQPAPTLNSDDGAEATPLAASTTRNPYLLLLAIVAVVLVAVGIVLFTQSGAQFNSSEVRSQGDYISLDATIHAAPFVSLLGAATAIGVVFVFAAQWRRRR